VDELEVDARRAAGDVDAEPATLICPGGVTAWAVGRCPGEGLLDGARGRLVGGGEHLVGEARRSRAG
ncbi:hypothetical protein, partial [Adlercreutzia caecimuris]|uniref:hypothetical protein n=1 Tax=Adlercreutzia caecimuris TaxID=671266 RepID=UPI002495724D